MTTETGVSAEAVASAFGLGSPIGALELLPIRSFVLNWRLETRDGAWFVKRLWPYDDVPGPERLARVMDLEQRAVLAGIDTPAPVAPVRPVLGSITRVDGQGLFRAYPYVRHRPVGAEDDLSRWAGTTLARIHQLRPLRDRPDPNWWYAQDPPVPHEQWLAWLDEGERTGTSWAGALRTHLPLVLDQSSQVAETFRTSPPYVVSHLDLKPTNVLMSGSGPVLIDWDSAGPESVPLEAAFVFIDFARNGSDEPDPDSIRRSHAAYVAAGGVPLTARPGLLDRRIGLHLATITTALGGYFQGGHSEEQIQARIEALPAVVAEVRAWERLLAAAIGLDR